MVGEPMLELYKAIDAIADKLKEEGVELPDALKRRDPLEPGRVMKEQYEDKLFKLMMRRFRIQKRNIAAYLAHFSPPKKAVDDFVRSMPDDLFETDEVEAKLLQLFIAASVDGVNLFAEASTMGLDWTLVNTRAAEWAGKYVIRWLHDLDAVTLKALRGRLEAFVSTPGYTIADVMSDLVPTLGESRAMRIAVTEITRVFSEADDLAGLAMKEEFPDIRIIKSWSTNNDDRVCVLCAPLHGVSVLIEDDFPFGGGNGPPRHVFCRCWRDTRPNILEDVPLGPKNG